MHVLRAHVMIPAVTMLMLLSGVGEASACDCPVAPDQEEAFDAAAAVFVGEVVEVREESHPTTGDALRVTRFQLGAYWKGWLSAEVEVATDDSRCAIHFTEGDTWLVYASVRADGASTTLWVDFCGRTVRAPAGEDEVEALGEPIWQAP